MTQADRIRQFVVHNYIEPARQAGQEYVTVRAGDVNKAMVQKGLLPLSRIPNVCNALRGYKLLNLANVELVGKTGHYESTTTTFRYLIRQPLYAHSVESASTRELESGAASRLPEPKPSLTSRNTQDAQMSGRRKWSELIKDFSPERKRRIREESAKLGAKMDRETHIEPIVLDWSEWHWWEDVERDARYDGVVVPNKKPGVYEVRIQGQKELYVLDNSLTDWYNGTNQSGGANARQQRRPDTGTQSHPEVAVPDG